VENLNISKIKIGKFGNFQSFIEPIHIADFDERKL